jgi:hypothetical protein
MRGWQIALLIMVIGVSLIAMSLLYLRPQALARAEPSRYVFWEPVVILASLTTAMGLVMLLLPEHFW